MYQALINEVEKLSSSHKAQLLDTYRRLLSDASLSLADVKSLQEAFPYLYSDGDELVACFGLDRRPTKHQLIIDQHVRYTWCIWDAFFIAQALGERAVIITQDPISEAELTATYHDNNWSVNDKYWVSFPNQKDDKSELRNAFCRYVHLFEDQQHAEQYQQQYPCDVFPVKILLTRAMQMANAMHDTSSQLGIA